MAKAKTKNTRKPDGSIRIIGGQWRGRKLPVPDLEGLRPTTDRVKETIFNWIQFDIPNRQILDVFAGTGSLGIEALSRGAKSAVFIEKSPIAAKQLESNLRTLQAEHSEVFQDDALSRLSRLGKEFDLVFLDPPFGAGMLQQSIDILSNNSLNECGEPLMSDNLLNNGSLIYIECEKGLSIDFPSDWLLRKEKHMGRVTSRLFEVKR